MFKKSVYNTLVFIFIANFFFEENHSFLIKRIIYSAFIYLATYQIIVYHAHALVNRRLVRVSTYFHAYIALFAAFIGVALFKDFTNPNLNIVTLFNNPFALLSVVPVFVFPLGTGPDDAKPLFNLLFGICLVFLFTCVVKLPGRVPYFEAYVASQAVLPFFLFSTFTRKKQALAIGLILVSLPFGLLTDQRIIIFRTLLFFALFIPLLAVRKSSFLKALVLVGGCILVFLLLTNLESLLAVFKQVIGSKGFDSNDTRSFLYEELFGDFKNDELVLGRGFLGTYLSNYFLELMLRLDDSGDFYQRFTSEVGFLELILKGGYVFYFLFTLPLWYVSFKSIFQYAQTKIVFFIGIYIFTELLLMFLSNGPYFGFQFSLMFFLAGYAYRMMIVQKENEESPALQIA